jgi:hypothetical protein
MLTVRVMCVVSGGVLLLDDTLYAVVRIIGAVCCCRVACHTGRIPWSELHDLVQDHLLREIRLGNNKFTDVSTIPVIVSNLHKVEVLTLHGLGYTGM